MSLIKKFCDLVKINDLQEVLGMPITYIASKDRDEEWEVIASIAWCEYSKDTILTLRANNGVIISVTPHSVNVGGKRAPITFGKEKISISDENGKLIDTQST